MLDESQSQVRRLPLVTLYLTERCNSRCVTCDYWRSGTGDLSLEAVEGLLPALGALQTRQVLISGGEPLMNRQWPQIAERLRSAGLSLWLLTSGLSLTKQATRVARWFDAVTVSLDGIDAPTYEAIRGLDAFEVVCEGVRAAVAAGLKPALRVTLQRRNFHQLPGFVALARELGASQVSFLAVDVANAHAFARTEGVSRELALQPQDLEPFERLIDETEQRYDAEFRSGFIAETPARLRRIAQYFAALLGQRPFPPVACNAPEFSAVVGARGELSPCFFIAGPSGLRALPDLQGALDDVRMQSLRAAIRSGQHAECRTCVCSMWRQAS